MMRKEFTSSVYILQENRVLLIFHKKLQKWLPPGGHVEPNELPSETALREAKEETGLDVQLILQENIWIEERWNGKSFARPFICLVEKIPPYKEQPAHQHIDFVYVGRPLSHHLFSTEFEAGSIRWFTFEEVGLLKKDVEIFDETFQVIKHLLIENKSLPYDQVYARV